MFDLFGAAILEYGITNLKMDFDARVCDSPIETLELKMRSFNCLKRGKINTVGDYLKNKSKLMAVKGCGSTTIKDVNTAIIKRQLSLLTEEQAKLWIAETILASN